MSNNKSNKKNTVVNSDKPMEVTKIVELKEYSKGVMVRLPDFAEGQPFVVRIRRPSMLNMVKTGKIPNQLLATANELFMTGKLKDVEDEGLLNDMFGIIDIVAEAALVEPTYAELKESGVELTDDQLVALFNYTQGGVDSLKQFREE